ncbi:MAG: right-handed parallel beta-helix repeat-containing protein [Lentisphaeraceae bacterium]|nr:right-handed parallel beta-helix repeat-containing protein [Lentisphaeraceae bacterium]
MPKILLILVLFCAGCSSTHHVITVNSDSANAIIGAKEKVKNYYLSNTVVKPVLVEIEPGHYFLDKPLTFDHSDSGTKEFPITYKVSDPENTLFSAGKELPKFQLAENGLWKCKVSPDWQFEQLFVNGKRAVRARTPNNSFFKITKITETKDKNKHIQTVDLPEGTLSSLPDNTDGLQMIVLHKWDHTRRFIDTLNKNTSTIVTSGKRMKPWNSWKKGTRVYFENFKSALDSAGEWYLDKDGWLFYMPLPGEDIKTTTTFAPVTEKFMVIEGDIQNNKPVTYLNFDGFRFAYSAMKTPASGFEPAQAAAPVEATMMVDGANNLTFTDFELNHIGAYGMWFRKGCSNILVQNSRITDMGAGGIRIGETANRSKENEKTHHITLKNNFIQNGGHIFPCAVGVWIGHSAYNDVINNDIGHLFYTAVSIGWTWGYKASGAHHNTVSYNHLHNIGKGLLSDMGAVYTLGNSPGTVISKNIIHDVDSYSYGGWGLYTDEGSQDVVMENNLVYNTKSGGFHQHYGKNNIIQKNIFVNSRLQQIQATRVEKHTSFIFKNNIVSYSQGELLAGPWDKILVESENNLYWNSAGEPVSIKGKSLEDWQKTGKEKDSKVGDPKFIDPEKLNFKVSKDSPALKLGIDFDFIDKAGLLK